MGVESQSAVWVLVVQISLIYWSKYIQLDFDLWQDAGMRASVNEGELKQSQDGWERSRR